MKLYFSPGACSFAARIIINELKHPVDFVKVNLREKKTETGEDFFLINPKGAVPTLGLDNGEILTENAVILQYLADSAAAYSLLPKFGDFERYRVLEWLNYITTELHKTFGLLFNPQIPQSLKDEMVIPLIKKKFTYINQQLKDSSYLYKNKFTLADAYLFVILRWASNFKIDLSEFRDLTNYFDQLAERPSIAEALKQEA